MSLCLLSRRLQDFGLSSFGSCFRISKAMIALLFDSVLLQSARSASQPGQQKSFWRQMPPPCSPMAEHTVTQVVGTRRGLNDSLIAVGRRRRLRHLFAVSKADVLSGSPDHSLHSTNVFLDDHLCLVCGTHSSASCPVCDQDFCSNHLYVCLDCDNRYCGSCLDDHRADGHWTDSDTATELSCGWRDKLVSARFPIGKDGFVFASNRTQCSCSDQAACQSHSRVICPVARNRPLSRVSHSDTLLPFTSLFVCVMRAVRSGLSSSAARAFIKLFPQSESYLEVCL